MACEIGSSPYFFGRCCQFTLSGRSGKAYGRNGTNRNVLQRLLELLDNPAVKIDERISNLTRLEEEILSYQNKICNKLRRENSSSENRRKHARSGHHERGANSRR